MSGSRIRFGLVGLGEFGNYLADFLEEVGSLEAVCEPDARRRQTFRNGEASRVGRFLSLDEMLEEKELDAVAVTTPNHTHRDLVIRAAQAGKHVFCEKAMANSTADCWAMVRACEESGVKLMVGHKRRLRPAWEQTIRLREELGEVTAIAMNLYYDARPYNHRGWWTREAESGGTLFLAGVHEIDWMHALCGRVSTVRAIAGPRLTEIYDFPDTVHLTLQFVSGAIAALNVSLACPLATFREASRPVILYKNGAARVEPAVDHIYVVWKSSADESERRRRFEDLGFEIAYRKELKDFVDWIREDRQPCLTWREGLMCVQVMEAARESLLMEGAVVQVNS